MTSTISTVAATIGVLMVFGILSKLFPYQNPPEVSPEELQRLKKRAQIIDLCALPVVFLATAGLTWLWTLGLYAFATWKIESMPPSRFLLKPEPYFFAWIVPAMFLGILSVGAISYPLMTLVLGKRGVAEYSIGSQARFRIANRALWFVGGAFAALTLLVIVLLQDCYVRFEEERVAVNPFFGLGEHVYPYSDIDRLVEASHFTAPNGNVIDRPSWRIVFRDGRVWCNEDLLTSDENAAAAPAIRSFLSVKTGKPFVKVKFFEDAK